MAATESSSLVTKTTVILEKPSDWQEWLFLRRDKATLNGIWEYCNPDMSQHELKKLIEPVRPTPATVAEGVTLRSQLTHEQRLDYQDLLDAWEYDQKTYLHRQKALNELTSEIAQTTARSNLYLLEGKSTAYERLKALKEHLSPNTARRSRELVVKYRDLQATRRGRAVEGWLDDWIKITDQMRTLNLPDGSNGNIIIIIPDVNGSRSQEDFLIAVKPLDDAWATMTLTDLLAKDEAGTPVPSLRDYVSKFRTFHSRTSPRAAGIGTFSATLGMADTNGGHKQRKPKCFCGEYHLFIECKYCNPKLREDGWQGDKDIFEAKERAKKHPKLKDYILRAEKGQGPSKKRPEMTSSKNGTASSSTSTPTPIRFDDDQLATSPIQTNALIQTFNTATTKVPHLMNRWVLDPGSNAHVCNTRQFGWSFVRKAKPGEVIYAGGQVVQIAEWGTVVLNVRTPSGKAPIKLTHVALVEGFFANVLGLSRCRPLGIHFDSGRDLLYQNNPSNVVAMLEYSNGHWLIDAEENDRPELSTLSTFAARFQPQRTSQKPRPAIVATANEAHQLWGHASKQAIDHLPESVTGFELVGDNKAPKWKDCDVCIQSKMTQQISRRTPEDTNTTPFYRVGIDLVQLLPQGEACYNGDKYAFHAICHSIKWHEVTTIPNRQKSTLVNVIKALIAKIQRQFEYTVVVFRIDSEPGYRELLYDVCKELGIKIEARAADTPAQNPNAERAGRVIVERGRALRISSGLPKELANELVITAAMLLNITPTESLDWETPYQRVFGRKPSVAHMAPIGCRAHVLDRKVKRGDKLESRTMIGYLVGYDSTNIFRIWIPSKGRVIRTRDVVFARQHLMKNDDEPEKLSEEAERLIEILDIPTPQALIDIEDLLSPLQKQTYEENNSLTQNDRNDAETATEKDIQFELGNLDKEFDNSATPESTIRVRHPDDSPTTPESMVSRRQNVPGGWGDQYQDYVPDRYQNNAPRRLNPEVGSQENVIEGHRRRHRANYSDHNHLSTNMTYYSTFLAAISQPETTKLFGELPKVRLYRDQLPPPPKRYRDVATHPFANEFQKAMNVEFDNSVDEAESELVKWVTESIQALGAAFPGGNYQMWEQCTVLLPHLKEVAGHRTGKKEDLMKQAESVLRAGWCLLLRDIRERVLGQGHPDTLTSVSELGLVLESQGKYEEAEAMHCRALEEYEEVLGREHPDTPTSVSELGLVCHRCQ
ncbi:TPR-10 multi-domain protein [Pyrenophora tritici-repentis]|uniref:TPR-10 multi-domain protein n=1 Tax=Pyrenophora tritici-repentis TaxID=45151 RepID=A0A922T0I8_9PLEO|nr:TPR-10 multi-domain protein [Pyrenophora tritici-repentis]